MLKLPRFRAAAVQASPVYLDPGATVDKAASLVREAAANGAKLVAFPEVFVPGYPYWNWITDPVTGSAWFEKLAKASVAGAGSGGRCRLQRRGRDTGCYVVHRRQRAQPVSLGAIYNTLRVHRAGRRAARQAPQAGADLGGEADLDRRRRRRACGSTIPRSGRSAASPAARTPTRSRASPCWLRASWCMSPATSRCRWRPPDYDMAEAIKLRAIAHSFEGKIFTIVSCSTMSEEIIAAMETDRPRRACAAAAQVERLLRHHRTRRPRGRRALIDDEGIVYADIDLDRCIQPKQMHDIVGHYNRFDIFDLRVNRRPLAPLGFADGEGDAAGRAAPDPLRSGSWPTRDERPSDLEDRMRENVDRPGQRRGHARAAGLLQGARRSTKPARCGRSPTRSSPGQPQSASVPVLWRYDDLREHVLRSVDLVIAGEGGAARDLSGQSRPPRRLGRGRLALFRLAGDESRRGRDRARAFGFGAALHHGRQGRLHDRRRAQDDARRATISCSRRTAPGTSMASKPNGTRLHLAGRPRHPAGQRAGGQFLRRASGGAAGRPAIRSTTSTKTYGAIPDCGRRRRTGRSPIRRCSSTSGGRPTRRLRNYAKATDGSPYRRHPDALRQSGDRRARDADDRRQHAVAAAGRADQGASAHRQLHLPGRQGQRLFDHRRQALRLERARHLLRAVLGLARARAMPRPARTPACSRFNDLPGHARRSASIAKRPIGDNGGHQPVAA